MAAQFDVCRLDDGTLVMVLQADFLGHLATRLVAPLIPERLIGPALKGVNPEFVVAGETCQLRVDFATALRRGQLGPALQSEVHRRDEIIRALDLLFTGI